MTFKNDRRSFLGALASMAVAGTASALPTRRAFGVEPITRNDRPKFKFSLAAYSYRNLLQGDSPELTLSDFIRDCAGMQLEATELTSYYFPDSFSNDYLTQLKQECFHLGLDVSGTAVRNDFGLPDGEKRSSDIAHVKKWIEYSELLGAPVIRIFAGHRQEGVSQQENHRRMVTGFEECCEYAGKHGVHLALENHGGPTSTAKGLLDLVRDVQSPWFGVNLDTGNFHGDSIYDEIAQAAPYALNVQVKVVTSGPDGVKRPTDYPRLAKILRDVGYRGYIVLEYEEGGDARIECPKAMVKLREAFN